MKEEVRSQTEERNQTLNLSAERSDLCPLSPVSIIIPVVRREKAFRCMDAIRQNAGIPEEQYEIIWEEDTDHIGAPRMVEKLVAKTKHDLVMFLGDDTIPQPDFLAQALTAMEKLPDGWGLVGLNDGKWDCAHWLADKRLLDHLPDNQFFSSAYTHCFCDNELRDHAAALNRFAFAPEAKIIHDHPQIYGGEFDEHYQKAYDKSTYVHDQRTYWSRKAVRTGYNLAVGLPIVGSSRHDYFWISLYAMQKPPTWTLITPKIPAYEFAWDIGNIRNDVVAQALETGVSHLLFLDTDQVYEPDTLVKLTRIIQSAPDEKIIAVAPVHRRYPPYDRIMLRGEPDKFIDIPDEEKYSGKIVEVDATGGGCMLIPMAVFYDIDEPWFPLSPCYTPNGRPMGEDIAFYVAARNKGWRILVDTSMDIDHLCWFPINTTFHNVYKAVEKSQQRRRA
jgi:GT2 family glycosyltransferase